MPAANPGRATPAQAPSDSPLPRTAGRGQERGPPPDIAGPSLSATHTSPPHGPPRYTHKHAPPVGGEELCPLGARVLHQALYEVCAALADDGSDVSVRLGGAHHQLLHAGGHLSCGVARGGWVWDGVVDVVVSLGGAHRKSIRHCPFPTRTRSTAMRRPSPIPHNKTAKATPTLAARASATPFSTSTSSAALRRPSPNPQTNNPQAAPWPRERPPRPSPQAPA